uniref:U34-Sparatoxin-Hju1b_1 n=1 Tax=Heteropoda jugulans TaxID=1358901 RepID=A0A4Q8K7M1_9ARAC
MKFILTVVFMAVTALVLVSAETPEGDALDILEGAREVCADAYKSCDTLKCCKGRPCKCNIIGQRCECKKHLVN